jgi:aspartate/tyrosine/aromatic aminotransferase
MGNENLKYDILSIQERAVCREAAGAPVINGCVGMLFRDSKKLCTYPSVNAVLKKRAADYLSYPAVTGSESYEKGVLKWVFGSSCPAIKKHYQIAFFATMGGTGAVSMIFHSFGEKKGCGILASVSWPNYRLIAKEAGLPLVEYDFLNQDGHFDIDALRKAIDTGLSRHSEAVIVLNDPCQNPTGYCLTCAEYQALFRLLSSYKGKASLLLDIAYEDYAPMGFFFPRLIAQETLSFSCYVAFSASKSFSLYGLRLGAVIALVGKNQDTADLLGDFREYARGTYSCPNNGALGPMSELLADPIRCATLKKAIRKETVRLTRIGKEMAKTLESLSLSHYPYGGGFFLTYTVPDSLQVCNDLESKDIYFAPVGPTLVRIAVSGLSLKEIALLKKRLA